MRLGQRCASDFVLPMVRALCVFNVTHEIPISSQPILHLTHSPDDAFRTRVACNAAAML